MELERVVYRGEEFTLEWYYTENGESPALEFFENLNNQRKREALKLFKLMGDIGIIFNKEKFRSEGDGIYAFKPKPDRFLCFFVKGKKIVITNAFEKKTQKLPKKEKEKALKYMNDYILRVKQGGYDEKK